MLSDDKQKTIRDWFDKTLKFPIFASAYWGAVDMVKNRRDGFVSYSSHFGRDVINILPLRILCIEEASDHYLGCSSTGGEVNVWDKDTNLTNSPKQGRVQYVDLLDGLASGWDTSVPCTNNSYSISKENYIRVSCLVDEHQRGSNRARDRLFLFITTLLGYDDQRVTPPHILEELRRGKKFFEANAHLNENTVTPDKEESLIAHFSSLESFLYAAAESQYRRLGEIDEFLDKANK